MILAGVGLFFHDRQQTADLATALSENAQLTRQLAEEKSTNEALQLQVRQLTAQVARVAAQSVARFVQPGAPAATPGASPGVWGLHDSGGLDRPAYKDH